MKLLRTIKKIRLLKKMINKGDVIFVFTKSYYNEKLLNFALKLYNYEIIIDEHDFIQVRGKYGEHNKTKK